MNKFWSGISFGGFLALWIQGAQCGIENHHYHSESSQKSYSLPEVSNSPSDSDSDLDSHSHEENFSHTPQLPEKIKQGMEETLQELSNKEKEKRVLFLIENKVPLEEISKIVDLSLFDIKKLGKKNGILLQKKNYIFTPPEEIKKYMGEMEKSALRSEKEKRAIFLLENNLSLGEIAKIVHMGAFDIKRLAEKKGILIRKNIPEVSHEIKKIMEKMEKNYSKEKKEQRIVFLLRNNVPITQIAKTIHISTSYVKKLAEQHNISIPQKIIRIHTQTPQGSDTINEYLQEMPKNAPREEKKSRISFLLENNIPITQIAKIVHMSTGSIKKLANENNLVVKKNIDTNVFPIFENFREILEKMPENALIKDRKKRAVILWQNKVPREKIMEITHLTPFDIKKLIEKNRLNVKQNTNISSFKVPDNFKEMLMEMPQNAPEKEREERVFSLIKNKVPIGKISKITHISPLLIEKLLEKNPTTL